MKREMVVMCLVILASCFFVGQDYVVAQVNTCSECDSRFVNETGDKIRKLTVKRDLKVKRDLFVDGKVGIGTDTPSDTLEVVGTGLFSSAVVDGDALKGSHTGTDGVGVFGEATALTGFTAGVEGVAFSPNGSAGVFVHEAGGRVLFGGVGPEPSSTQVFAVEGNGDVWLAGRLLAVGTGNSSIAGNVAIGSALNVGSNVAIGSNVTIGGTLDVGSNVAIVGNVALGGALNVGSNVAIGSNVTISGALDVGSDVAIGSNVTISGTLDVGSDVAIVSDVAIGSNLNVGKDVSIGGTLNVAGTKNFVQPHPMDPSREIVYVAAEAPEAIVIHRGTAQLKNGKAVIKLPEHFRVVAAEKGVQVQVTPLEDCNGIFIESKNRERIVVKELMGGKHNAKFDYLATAVRSGFEGHEPIVANTHFKPRADETAQEFETRYSKNDMTTKVIRTMLISNGILTGEGNLNMAKVKELGWVIAEDGSLPKYALKEEQVVQR